MKEGNKFLLNLIKYQEGKKACALALDQDMKFGSILIFLSCILVWQVFSLPPSSALYPRALIYLTAFSGLGILFSAYRNFRDKGIPYRKLSFRDFLFESGLPGAVLLAFFSLAESLGFYVVSFLVIIAVSVLQEYIVEGRYRLTRKSAIETFIFAAGTTILLYVSFSFLLSLPTPTGVFGF